MKLIAILSKARNKVLAESKVLILLYIYLAVFALGQLGRFTLSWPEISLHLADIAVGILIATWLGWKLYKGEKLSFPPLTKQIALFFSLAFLSLVLNSFLGLSGREMVVSWLYLLRWIFYAGLYFVIYDLVQKDKNLLSGIRKYLIGAGLGITFLGLLQYFFLPDTRFLESYGWDPHYFRLIGTFLDPGFLGLILVLALVLIFLSLRGWPLVASGLAVYIALALTYSRASYLAFLAAMGMIAWFKKSPKIFLSALIVLIITIFLLPRPGGEGVRLERESTIVFRLINWGQSLEIAKDNLLFGVGFNAYRYAQRDYGFLEFANWRASHAGGGADSSLLFVLATTGIFGFLAYIWLWGKILARAFRKRQVLILASVLAVLVHSFFQNSLFYPWVMGWIWILLGAENTRG